MIRVRAATLVLVALTAACSNGGPGGTRQITSSPTARSTAPTHASADVPLVTAPAALRRECNTAARQLGFAVPCPTRVVIRGGKPLACTPSPIPTTLPLCVGPEHDFFLEWNGFEVPSTFVGVDAKAVGHVIIHAGLAVDSPSQPCIGGVVIGTVIVLKSHATEYRCPPDSPLIERVARHGEGAYTSHVLLEWRQEGVDYLVSSHGYATASVTLMIQLAGSATLVAS